MRIGRLLGVALMVPASVPCGGCGIGPRTFRKIEHPAPLVRARSIGRGTSRPDSQVVPALIGRLEDADPVVRLAAHEELRRRTGRDFGFVPWAGTDERSGAIARWRSWLRGGQRPAAVATRGRSRAAAPPGEGSVP